MGTEGGHGPIVAHELRYSEMPDVCCNRSWRHVRSTCNLLPVYLVGPVKQWIHMSKENLHILSQSLSSVSLVVKCTAYIVQCTELGLENLFYWVWIEKNKFFKCSCSELIPSSPSLWWRCPTCLFVLLYVHLILVDPFLCFAVFQMCSAHAIKPIFLPNAFSVWQSSVHSTEESWACSGLTWLLCSLFCWLRGWYLVQGEK